MSDSSNRLNRRDFLKGSILTAARRGGSMTSRGPAGRPAPRRETDEAVPVPKPSSKATLPTGPIHKLNVSRMILGGNLLTHYTHSRDLRLHLQPRGPLRGQEDPRDAGDGGGYRHQHDERAQPAPGIVEILQPTRKAGGEE